MVKLIIALVVFATFGGAALAGAVDDAKQCGFKIDDWKIEIDDSEIEYCNKAIESGELSVEELAVTYANRGLMYFSVGDLDRAFADVTYALQLKPFLAKAYIGWGAVYQKKGKKHLAFAYYSQAIRFEHDNAAALTARTGLLLN